MYEHFVAAILKHYGITALEIMPVQKGYRNEIYPIKTVDGIIQQITIYKNETGIVERMKRADAVSLYAANNGLPTRRRLDERTVVLTGESRKVYAGLYNYLPGSTISWEAYSKRHIKLLGQAMSDLHAILKDFPTQPVFVIDELEVIVRRMKDYFKEPHTEDAIKEKLQLTVGSLDKFNTILNEARKLPQQQLHMDFVRGNILFNEKEISGILDFEKTAVGHPIFDVARTLAFLIVDCKYKTEDQVRRYFLQSGYTKRGAQKLDHYPIMLEQLIQLFLLYDFYKFLRHTPYESLHENEHFVRTRDVLRKRGMLHYM